MQILLRDICNFSTKFFVLFFAHFSPLRIFIKKSNKLCKQLLTMSWSKVSRMDISNWSILNFNVMELR